MTKEEYQLMEKCPRFERCNLNLCPLDVELDERWRGGKCRFFNEEKTSMISGAEVTFGGKLMPDDLLACVPIKNVPWLNRASQKRFSELKVEKDN